MAGFHRPSAGDSDSETASNIHHTSTSIRARTHTRTDTTRISLYLLYFPRTGDFTFGVWLGLIFTCLSLCYFELLNPVKRDWLLWVSHRISICALPRSAEWSKLSHPAATSAVICQTVCERLVKEKCGRTQWSCIASIMLPYGKFSINAHDSRVLDYGWRLMAL